MATTDENSILMLRCPYCNSEQGEIKYSETWIVVSQVIANEFQGYTKQCNEEVIATSCPNCQKGFMVKNESLP